MKRKRSTIQQEMVQFIQNTVYDALLLKKLPNAIRERSLITYYKNDYSVKIYILSILNPDNYMSFLNCANQLEDRVVVSIQNDDLLDGLDLKKKRDRKMALTLVESMEEQLRVEADKVLSILRDEIGCRITLLEHVNFDQKRLSLDYQRVNIQLTSASYCIPSLANLAKRRLCETKDPYECISKIPKTMHSRVFSLSWNSEEWEELKRRKSDNTGNEIDGNNGSHTDDRSHTDNGSHTDNDNIDNGTHKDNDNT